MRDGVVIVLVVVLVVWWCTRSTASIGPSQCNRRVTLRSSFHDYAVYSVLETGSSPPHTTRAITKIASVFRCKFGDCVGDRILGCIRDHRAAMASGDQARIDSSSDRLASCLAKTLGRDQCDMAAGVNEFTDSFSRTHGDQLETIAVRSECAVKFADLLCGIVLA